MAGLRAGILLSAGLAVWVFGTGPLAPYRRALFDRSAPQLVLVLGGDVDRERVGARLARELQLPLLVSGGSNPEYATWLIQEEAWNPSGLNSITALKTPLGISPHWWISFGTVR